jgi:hypothetical protein
VVLLGMLVRLEVDLHADGLAGGATEGLESRGGRRGLPRKGGSSNRTEPSARTPGRPSPDTELRALSESRAFWSSQRAHSCAPSVFVSQGGSLTCAPLPGMTS